MQIEKKTGLFWGTVFVVAGLYNIPAGLVQHLPWDQVLTNRNLLIPTICGLVFFLSAAIPRIRYVQAIILLAYSPLGFYGDPSSMFGFGFFVSGVIMLFLFQFFRKYGAVKIVILLVYFYALQIISFATIPNNVSIVKSAGIVIFITAFLFFLYIVFQEKILIYLKPTKPNLRLSEKGLSQTEINYVMALLDGQTAKEIAFDREVAESTVRNTLSRAYKKLGVQDRLGLAALTDKFKIIA